MTVEESVSGVRRTSFNIPFITFAVIFLFTWITGWFLSPSLIIEPRLKAKILARARSFPDAAIPRLNLLPVIYNQETHVISSFITNFEKCLGLFYFSPILIERFRITRTGHEWKFKVNTLLWCRGGWQMD